MNMLKNNYTKTLQKYTTVGISIDIQYLSNSNIEKTFAVSDEADKKPLMGVESYMKWIVLEKVLTMGYFILNRTRLHMMSSFNVKILSEANIYPS